MERRTYNASEVSELLGTSKAYAYKIIRRLNSELECAGKITLPGKIPAAYFEERLSVKKAMDGGED